MPQKGAGACRGKRDDAKELSLISLGVRVLGEEGMLETSSCFEGGEIPKSAFTYYPKTGAPKSPNVPGHDPYGEECKYFVRCVQGEADPALLSAEAAREALRVSLAAKKSLKQGKRVLLK